MLVLDFANWWIDFKLNLYNILFSVLTAYCFLTSNVLSRTFLKEVWSISFQNRSTFLWFNICTSFKSEILSFNTREGKESKLEKEFRWDIWEVSKSCFILDKLKVDGISLEIISVFQIHTHWFFNDWCRKYLSCWMMKKITQSYLN